MKINAIYLAINVNNLAWHVYAKPPTRLKRIDLIRARKLRHVLAPVEVQKYYYFCILYTGHRMVFSFQLKITQILCS